MSSAPFSHRLRVSQLNPRQPNRIDLMPDEGARQRIAAELGLTAPPEVRLTATITAAPNDAWLLEGRIAARVQQPCVVTLAPVRSRIAAPLDRRYGPAEALADADAEDAGLEDDDVPEVLVDGVIDLGEAVAEQLALEIDPFPRAEGAEFSG